ncbi:MAG: DUF6149 family protein [Halobacteriota archaeon]
MKLRQNIRHFAAKQALTMPVVGDIATEKLVDLHVRVFGGRADDAHREERIAHLEGFFRCTFDAYVAALEAGYTEAEAREITHVQSNFDFYNHGWTEMMEFPVEEIDDHYDRYREFFEAHDITVENPLGEFRNHEVPDAPATPERLDAEQPHAVGGYADDVYVEDDEGTVRVGGQEEPADVDVRAAPGLQDIEDSEA